MRWNIKSNKIPKKRFWIIPQVFACPTMSIRHTLQLWTLYKGKVQLYRVDTADTRRSISLKNWKKFLTPLVLILGMSLIEFVYPDTGDSSLAIKSVYISDATRLEIRMPVFRVEICMSLTSYKPIKKPDRVAKHEILWWREKLQPRTKVWFIKVSTLVMQPCSPLGLRDSFPSLLSGPSTWHRWKICLMTLPTADSSAILETFDLWRPWI